MERAQRLIFGDAAVRIVGCGIVANTHQFDALQAQHAPGFRPAAIVADHHAHDRVAPIRPGPKGGKSEVAISKIALFELLVARAGAGLDRTRQMDLAITAEYFAVVIDQDGTIEALTVRRQFGVPDIETDPERPRAIEQRLHPRIRHVALKVMI